MPFHPPSAHQVVAFVDLGDEQRDFRRIVLKVAVQRDDHFALRVIEPCLQSGGLAEIPAQANGSHPAVMRADFPKQGVSSVGAAVVDKDNLVGTPHRIHDFHDLHVKWPKVIFLVVKRNHD